MKMSHRGGVTERKDGKVGKMSGEVVQHGGREEGGNYCTACFLSKALLPAIT